jgi:uncharacterized protein
MTGILPKAKTKKEMRKALLYLKIKWVAFGALQCALCLSVQAQERLFVQATSYTDAVVMHFFPLKPSDWTKDVAAGYRVTRVEVDSASSTPKAGTEIVITAASKPQAAQWFEEHQAEEEGLMQAIGALLYDTSFQFKDRSLIDPDSMRWNYVMFEVLNRPYVALATGFLVPDTLAVHGKTYRYDISCLIDPSLRASFILTHGSSSPIRIPASFDPEKFNFPASRSLSDMIPRLEKPIMPQVFALAKAYGDSIAIRWAPSSAQMWFTSNQKGYHLVKYQEVKPNEFEVMDTLGLIKPWSREQVLKWVERESTDSMAFLAASLLYNEIQGEVLPVSDQAQVFQTKYGFALFAAESSALAAQILGLGFMDKKVQRGKTYAYRVIALDASSAFSQGDTKVKNEFQKDLKPVGFEAKSGDRLIELKWELLENKSRYSAYQLERTPEKANTWKPLTNGPLTFVDSDVAAFPEYAFRDSVQENYVKYQYRLRGLDSFGDWSTWAETTGEAKDLTPPMAPSILLANYNDTTNIATIRWELLEVPNDLKVQKVTLAFSEISPEVVLAEFKSDAREFLWKPDTMLTGDRSYLIRVIAEDVNGNKGISIERTMLVPDLIAPEPPAVVVGNITEAGEVNVVWEHSIAKDIKAYHVMWANDPEHEFSQVNQQMIVENAYTWTIETESLTEYIYVCVAAVDQAYNRGLNSKTIKIKRPDQVPPIPARMVSGVQEGKGVALQWEPSPSTDVAKQYLMRRLSGNEPTEWVVLDSLNVVFTNYRDTTITAQEQFSYALFSKDESGNKSGLSNAVTVHTRFSPELAEVLDFTIKQTTAGKVELTWRLPEQAPIWTPKGQSEMLIHRSTGNDFPKLIARTPQAQTSFSDSGLVNGVLYNYMVKWYFKDAGETGKPSPIKSVFGKTELTPIETDEADVKVVVKGKNRTILSEDEFPSLDDNTDFGIVGTGTTLSHGFSLFNNGTDKLKLPSNLVNIETADAGVWKVLQPENQVIAGYGGSEDFIIEFQPKAAKTYIAKVKIGGKTPYEFSIKGEGTSKAELEVIGRDVAIVNGQTLPTKTNDSDFEVVQTGNEARHVFKIKNIGATPLTLKSEPRLTGDSVFSMVAFKMPTGGKIAPGAEVPFTIFYSPKETGGHHGQVYILTDDEDEAQFDFAIGGVAIGPEINMSGGLGGVITDGSIETSETNGTSFGKVAINTTFTRVFTVKNSGNMGLNLSGKPRVMISGLSSDEFKLVQEPAAEIMPGDGTSLFKIAFSPKSKGKKLVRAYLETNDINEGIFEFVLDGEGSDPAQLKVIGLQKNLIKNGQTKPLETDGTDFGAIKKGQEITREFQIINTGGADYRIAEVLIEGEGVPFFKIAQNPELTIQGGTKGTIISIRFKPEATGNFPVTLTIKSQYNSEPAYQFSLLGVCSDK